MVLNQDTQKLLKGLGVKLALGLFGFTAAFASQHVVDFHLNPIVAGAIVALLDDVSKWISDRGQVAQKVARAVSMLRR